MGEYDVVVGDNLHTLKQLGEHSFHCCVTSPPYFGLRDYGLEPTIWPEFEFTPVAGLPPIHVPAMTCCLGLEKDPWHFIGHMVLVFREVRRVLRDDGTCWINLGDSYARHGGTDRNLDKTGKIGNTIKTLEVLPNRNQRVSRGLKQKDQLGIPWRVALALQADGWYLRQDIIWHKTNPMPESVRDRCTKAHEYVFLLSKSPKYYFDHEAIKEPANLTGKGNANSFRGGAYVNNSTFNNSQGGNRTVTGNTRSRRDSFKRDGSKREQTIPGQAYGTHRPDREESDWDTSKRNKRSVWSVATRGFKGAHFATFPPALIEPCILAGCPEGGRVLDIYGGSGTTAGVSVANGRDCTLLELSGEYQSLIEERVSSVVGLIDKARKKPA